MPGIFGFFCKHRSDKSANQRLIDAMLGRLSYNDDFERATWANDWSAIGTIGFPVAGERRLTIDEPHGVAAAFSGYIYGWKDATAAESVPAADKAGRLLAIYREVGPRFAEKPDGSFNAVIIDSAKKKLVLGNDRMGHRQMYYVEDDDLFLFSTELKAFLAYEGFDRTIDKRAIADYFNIGYCIGDRTFFKAVRRLGGGHVVEVTSSGARFIPYWDFNFDHVSTASVPEMVEEIDTMYRDIIRKQVGDSRDIIVPLSGGLDSRFILAHVLQLGREPHCFTHGVPGCLDLEIAREIASSLNVKNHRFIHINPQWFVDYHDRFVFYTEGMISTVSCMLLGISAQYGLPARTTHFANGIFGGPTNFGSPYFRPYDMVDDISHSDKLRNLKRSLFGDLATPQSYEKFAPEFGQYAQTQYDISLEEEFAHFEARFPRFYQQKDVFFIRNRLARFMNQVDCHRYIWHDHFALYDDRLVDFYMKLPAELMCGRRLFMEYFKQKRPDLARISYQSTGVNLFQKPTAMQQRLRRWNKRYRYLIGRLSLGKINLYNLERYYQYDPWFRTHRPLRDMVTSMLLDKRTLERGYFDRKGIERLISWEMRGGNDFGAFASMTALESFFRQFVDR